MHEYLSKMYMRISHLIKYFFFFTYISASGKDENPITYLSFKNSLIIVDTINCSFTTDHKWLELFQGQLTDSKGKVLEYESKLNKNYLLRNYRLNNIWVKGGKTQNLLIISDSTYLTMSNAEVKELTVQGQKMTSMEVVTNYIQILNLINTKINKLHFDIVTFPESYKFFIPIATTAQVDTMIFEDVKIFGSVDFANLPYPKFIHLKSLRFYTENSFLDFTHFSDLHKDAICRLKIENINDINHIRLNYEDFQLVFPDEYSNWKKERIYRLLLEEQSKDGFTFGFQKLDKEYKEFEYVATNIFFGKMKNWVDKSWWDYGYNKFLVIPNSFKIFFFFFLINLLFYHRMIDIYSPKKFKELEDRLTDSCNNLTQWNDVVKFKIYRIPIVFLYTGYIFWGIRFNFEDLELRKPLTLLIITIEYIIGLICLAYIANYIISK